MAAFFWEWIKNLAIVGGAFGTLALLFGWLDRIQQWGGENEGVVLLGLLAYLFAYWCAHIERTERRDAADWRKRMLDDYVRRDDKPPR
jgi:hypothetical protein